MSEGLGQLRRAAASEVPPQRHWHLRAVFEIEKERIERWLRSAAVQNLGAEGSTSETALDTGKTLPDTLKGYMGIEQRERRDPTVKARAESQELEKSTPTRTWLRSLGVLKWLFMLAEISLFVLQWLVGVSSPIVIIHGLVLSFAAFLVGWGLGMIGLDPELGGGRKNPRIWAAIAGGVVGILGVVALRSSSGGEGVWVVVVFTLVLALLIVLFEALHVHGKTVYADNQRQMFQAQQWVAKDQHTRDYESGLWWKSYERFVDEIAQDRDKLRPMRPGDWPPQSREKHNDSA